MKRLKHVKVIQSFQNGLEFLKTEHR